MRNALLARVDSIVYFSSKVSQTNKEGPSERMISPKQVTLPPRSKYGRLEEKENYIVEKLSMRKFKVYAMCGHLMLVRNEYIVLFLGKSQ